MIDNSPRGRRARPVLALAAVAFAIGAIVGANHAGSAAHALAGRFVAAWARRDYAAMYLATDETSRRAMTASEFAGLNEAALRTATATRMRVAGSPRDAPGGLVAVPVLLDTRLFGTLALSFELQIAGSGSSAGVEWSRSDAFPGLRPGEVLSGRTELPRRAALLARDGSVLAAGAAASAGARSSPLGEAAAAVVGEVGRASGDRRSQLEARGVPAHAIVGTSGLELWLDDRLRGAPGGELLAHDGRPGGGARVLASSAPRPAPAVRSSLSPRVQRAAVSALGGQLGGIVAMQPSTGQILAVAGIGLDGLQPPGSTFKIVTLTGALEAKLASRHTVFGYATFATLDGVRLKNANGEECGGTLETAFAVSCNSVFAPLGVRLGAARLVAAAERFGFNHEAGLQGAAESTLPAAAQIQGELALGSTAIGQGQVQASALEMATVAATIADGGRRPRPTFSPSAASSPSSAASSPSAAASGGTVVTSRAVAATVRRLMIDVVRNGTGTSAAIPGVVVAGKTGTAELMTQCQEPTRETAEPGSREPAAQACRRSGAEASAAASNTDAWFAAFAPALHPRIAVGVLLVKDGAGGETAAPVARQVLEAGLHEGG
jgi:penicillin-binding protein A